MTRNIPKDPYNNLISEKKVKTVESVGTILVDRILKLIIYDGIGGKNGELDHICVIFEKNGFEVLG